MNALIILSAAALIAAARDCPDLERTLTVRLEPDSYEVAIGEPTIVSVIEEGRCADPVGIMPPVFCGFVSDSSDGDLSNSVSVQNDRAIPGRISVDPPKPTADAAADERDAPKGRRVCFVYCNNHGFHAWIRGPYAPSVAKRVLAQHRRETGHQDNLIDCHQEQTKDEAQFAQSWVASLDHYYCFKNGYPYVIRNCGKDWSGRDCNAAYEKAVKCLGWIDNDTIHCRPGFIAGWRSYGVCD